jgi:hypothetical protein
MKIRKENKQTCILVCLSMYVCMRSESESVSHSSPPQLKGVRVISACVCVCARVCWYYYADLSTGSVSLPVHTVTHTHTQATLKNTGTYLSSNDRKSTRSLKHSISVLSHDKHAHSHKR